MALCKNPYFHQGMSIFFGCGQCHICRINKRREWCCRLVLESSLHKDMCFPTFTYAPEHLPKDGELKPDHMKSFIKKLRRRLEYRNRKLTYYYCGEYGEEKGRPHYHAILYGVKEIEENMLQQCWEYGNVFQGSVTQDSIQYVCGYILKKGLKTKKGLKKQKEFARMSLKPAIGKNVAKRIAEQFMDQNIVTSEMSRGGDAPSTIKLNGKHWPLGRYLKKLIRKELGINEEEAQAFNKEFLQQETEQKIKEIKEKAEFTTEVNIIEGALGAGCMDQQEAMQHYMRIYNKSKYDRSVKLHDIYKKQHRRLET